MSAEVAHRLCAEAGVEILDVRPAHVLQLETLPKHHDDPFDRLLVAIALSEPSRLSTHDARLTKYSDLVMLV